MSSTWAPVNEPEALSFQVPASLGPGVYQVAIWHGGGESARLSLDVGSVAAPVQVLSCPANLEAGERFVIRASGTRSDTSINIVQDETPIGTASAPWQAGIIWANLDLSASVGPASIVLTTDLGGASPVRTTQAISISTTPDPPILYPSFRYGVPIAGPGQYVTIEASSAPNWENLTAEITQGDSVVSSSAYRETDLVNVNLSESLLPGPATVRVKAQYNGVEAAWSNSIPIWISDELSVGYPTAYLPLTVPGKTVQLFAQGIAPDSRVEVTCSGNGTDWAASDVRPVAYGQAWFTAPPDSKSGPCTCRLRSGPSGSAALSKWSAPVYLEVMPPPEAGSSLTLAEEDWILIPFPHGFRFPFAGQNWDRLWISSNGSVTFGTYWSNWYPDGQSLRDGPARIAPLWADLDPSWNGSIRFEHSGTWFDAIYEEVPQYEYGNRNTVRVRLFSDGRFDFIYGDVQLEDQLLVGFSQGGGLGDPGETDFSSLDLTRGIGTGTESS
ncbi:MAG: hypothetical protein EHM18_14335, partial [Acidobacteria bacterium]